MNVDFRARVLLVFVDGIGYGRPGAHNPFDGAPVEILAPLGDRDRGGARGVRYAELDATLGYAGLPQSATGQAALFTGEDAVAVAGGHHVSGYPTRALCELLLAKSILARARRGALLNAYDHGRAASLPRWVREGFAARARDVRPSASTMAALAGNGHLRTVDDAAVPFDFTGEIMRAFGVAAPRRSVREAARALASAAAEHDVAIFETFLTDKAGHAQDVSWARSEIVRLEHFLDELFAVVDFDQQLVLVTSDHGNLEDLSTRSHTRAPVPLLAYGAAAEHFLKSLPPSPSLRHLAEPMLAAVASAP